MAQVAGVGVEAEVLVLGVVGVKGFRQALGRPGLAVGIQGAVSLRGRKAAEVGQSLRGSGLLSTTLDFECLSACAVRIPLTPALSRREREKPMGVFGESRPSGFVS